MSDIVRSMPNYLAFILWWKELAFKPKHKECKVICKAFVGKAKMMFWYASRKRKKELYMCRESST